MQHADTIRCSSLGKTINSRILANKGSGGKDVQEVHEFLGNVENSSRVAQKIMFVLVDKRFLPEIPLTDFFSRLNWRLCILCSGW